MIDKIISIVITVLIIMIAAIIVYVSVFSGSAAELDLARHGYEAEYGDLLVESLFIAHENASGISYESLLARSLESLSTNVTVRGQEIDVEQEFRNALDSLLGEDAYFLSVDPIVEGVSISYILDGSDTMASKRATIADELPGLVSRLRGLFGENATIITHLYILSTPGSGGRCSEFPTGPKVTCVDLTGEELYEQLLLSGYSPPAPEPFSSFSEWQFSGTAAQTEHLSQSDWAAAAAYASLRYREDVLEQALTNKHVIVAIADELSSSSKADECFGLDDQTDVLFCTLCLENCPAKRSEALVNQTAQLLSANGDLFIGFYSFACDYAYDTSLDSYSLTPYTCQFIDDQSVCAQVRDTDDPETPPNWINPPANANWCAQSSCGACEPAQGQYCFHRACDAIIKDQIETLANATGGPTLDLVDLSQLTDTVYDYFDARVRAFNFTIGAKSPGRDRYVLDRRLRLSNGREVELSIWMYD